MITRIKWAVAGAAIAWLLSAGDAHAAPDQYLWRITSALERIATAASRMSRCP